mgnify:CR=1 FL=1
MSEAKDNPGVIAPPPLIYLGFLLIGWAVERYLLPDLSLGLPDMVRRWGAVILIVVGFMLEGAAAERFRSKRTAIEPWKASTALATDGVYRFSRNPIYVGFAVIYAGLAVGMDAPVALALLVPCLVMIDLFVIRREERYLEGKFGEAYRDYVGRVRRWL